MKITHNKVGQNLNLTDSGKAEKSKKVDSPAASIENLKSLPEEASTESSKVNLSQRSQDIRKAKEIAQKTPDVRADRVLELQKRIDEGTYLVDAKDIADKMVDEELQWS